MRRLLLLLLAAAPVLGIEVPAALTAGIAERLVYDPPLVTESGGMRFELLECGRLEVAGEPFVRAIVRVTGAALPEDMVMLGQPLATAAGRELPPAEPAVGLRQGDSWWLAVTLPAPPPGGRGVFGGSIGSRPRVDRHRVALPLDPIAEPRRDQAVGRAVRVDLLRRESAMLPVDSPPVPLESIIESTAASVSEPPAATEERPYITLRLHTLAPADSEWRLAGVRLEGDGGAIEHWRYVRREWRPDWGAWFGATGRDGEAAGQAGVWIEEVAPSSPAEEAGIRPGDLILAADRRRQTSAFALGAYIRRLPAGERLGLRLRRGAAELDLVVTLGGRPLWPDRDPAEFEQAWAALRDGEGDTRVLSQWDWQSWEPPPPGFEPSRLELVYERTEAPRATTFLFRDVPWTAD